MLGLQVIVIGQLMNDSHNNEYLSNNRMLRDAMKVDMSMFTYYRVLEEKQLWNVNENISDKNTKVQDIRAKYLGILPEAIPLAGFLLLSSLAFCALLNIHMESVHKYT